LQQLVAVASVMEESMSNPRPTRRAARCLPGEIEQLGAAGHDERRPRGRSARQSRGGSRRRKLDARRATDDRRVGVRSRVGEKLFGYGSAEFSHLVLERRRNAYLL